MILPRPTQPLLRLLLAALAVQSILIAGQNWGQAKGLAGAGTVQHDGAPVTSQQDAPAQVVSCRTRPSLSPSLSTRSRVGGPIPSTTYATARGRSTGRARFRSRRSWRRGRCIGWFPAGPIPFTCPCWWPI